MSARQIKEHMQNPGIKRVQEEQSKFKWLGPRGEQGVQQDETEEAAMDQTVCDLQGTF